MELFPEVKTRFHVRCFNLGRENRLRDLDPNDIDKLVRIKGMVTRTSNIIPDLKMGVADHLHAHCPFALTCAQLKLTPDTRGIGFFECSICATPQEAFVDAGQIPEPQVGGKCLVLTTPEMRIDAPPFAPGLHQYVLPSEASDADST